VSNDNPQDDLRARWQGQRGESAVSLEAIRARAAGFERRIRTRNIREYFAASGVVVWLAASILILEPVFPLRVAFLLMMASAVIFMWQLHRRASSRLAPADLGRTACIDFLRRELERQRDAVRSVWYWGILPATPGVLLVVIALLFAPHGVMWSPLFGAWFGIGFFVIGRLNQRAAQRLQREIDQLHE